MGRLWFINAFMEVDEQVGMSESTKKALEKVGNLFYDKGDAVAALQRVKVALKNGK